jgi:PAS domain S-box-containing protein
MMNLQDSGFQPEKQNIMFSGFPIPSASITPAALPSVRQNILTALLDLAPDALIVVDSEGTITQVNAQIETLFGYGQDELVGHPLELLLPEGRRVAHVVHRLRYMQAASPRPMGIGLDLVGRRKDGSEFPIDINLRPILIEQTLHVMGAVRGLTAQRLAEHERAHIAERLRQQDQLISMAHDAILVRDPEGRILSWNEGAEHLYGWTVQEAIGKVKYTLLQTRFPISREEVEHALEEHGQWEGELIHTCRDGRQVIVESRQVLACDDQGVPTTILEINRDITARRRIEHLEQKVHDERDARLHVLQLILDCLSSGVFLAQGPQLRLLMANKAMTEVLGAEWQQGQPGDDFLRQHDVRFFTTDGRPLLLADMPARHAMASGEPVFHSQMVIRRPDGSRLPILLDAIPFEHLHHLPHLFQEMTEVLTSEQRVVLAVYHDVTTLKDAEALKDQFVSLATHELRTPVSVIAGYADLCLRRAAQGKHLLDEWQVSKLQGIKQATQQLANLAEDLLDVTRIQSGQFQLDLHPTDLLALTRRVIERLQTTTTHHQVSLHTTLAHLWATVDALRIEQVLSNLLNNAIKYSPQGGPIEVTLEEERQTQEASFSIRDHGIGIPQEQQPYLFRRFMRANNVRTAGIHGTGLGLYLCQELIERHRGHIYFKSEEGVGSTFFFSLPLTMSTD